MDRGLSSKPAGAPFDSIWFVDTPPDSQIRTAVTRRVTSPSIIRDFRSAEFDSETEMLMGFGESWPEALARSQMSRAILPPICRIPGVYAHLTNGAFLILDESSLSLLREA